MSAAPLDRKATPGAPDMRAGNIALGLLRYTLIGLGIALAAVLVNVVLKTVLA